MAETITERTIKSVVSNHTIKSKKSGSKFQSKTSMKLRSNLKGNKISNSPFLPEQFWNYSYISEKELNDKTLAGIKINNQMSVADAINNLYLSLSSGIHPVLKKAKLCEVNKNEEQIKNTLMKKKTSKIPMEIKPKEEEETTDDQNKKENTEVKQLNFTNIKVDINTIKILFHVISELKIVSLIFSNNSMTLDEFRTLIDSIINKPNNIYAFSFEFNSGVNIDSENGKRELKFNEIDFDRPLEEERLILSSLSSLLSPSKFQKLEYLSLRFCLLGDGVTSSLFSCLASNNVLSVLNLYGNLITKNSIHTLCETLRRNRSLQEINLGGNKLDDEAVKGLREGLGKFELTEEEKEEEDRKKKEKEEIEAFNKKNKNNSKVKQKPVPFLDEIKEEEIFEGDESDIQSNVIDDILKENEEENLEQNKERKLLYMKYFRVKNDTLTRIDLMGNNGITQKSFEDIIYIIDHTSDLIFNLDLRKYDKDSVMKMIDMTGKYFNRIFLCK